MDPEAVQLSSVDVDRAIELLSLIRTSSKGNGSIRADQLFASDGLFTSTLLCGRRNDTSQVISTLQKLKSLSATLSAISEMLESAIPELSREFMPHMQQAGMASFPQEILASIFEYAYEFAGRDRDKFTTSIVRVCRRYRQIAVRTPKLWTCIKFMAGHDVNPELYFTLSRGKALSVEIDCDSFSSTEQLIAIMHSIKPAVHRLEELTIRAMEDKPHTSSFLTHLRESYDEVDFCALKTLRLEYWEPEWTFDSDLANDDAEEAEELKKMFFRSWKIPALKELALSNHIPTDDFIGIGQLTSLHLTLGSDWDQGRDGEHSFWDTDLLLDFLRSFEESEILDELSIKLILVGFCRSEDDDPVNLPSVSKLKIDVEGVWPKQFARLAKGLIFPNVEHLDLRLWMYSEEQYSKWFRPFFKDTSFGGKNLRSLSLSVEVEERDVTNVAKMLQYHPNLRALTLKGNFPLPGWRLGEHLEMLRIEDSSRIHRQFLDLIRSASDERPRANPLLRNIEIVNCPSIDDRAFRDNLLQGTELVWHSNSKAVVINGRAPRSPSISDRMLDSLRINPQSDTEGTTSFKIT